MSTNNPFDLNYVVAGTKGHMYVLVRIHRGLNLAIKDFVPMADTDAGIYDIW